MAREYKKVRTVIPEFWSEELKSLFKLWLNDMNQGLRPYTPVTAQTFVKRFILSIRRQWVGQVEEHNSVLEGFSYRIGNPEFHPAYRQDVVDKLGLSGVF